MFIEKIDHCLFFKDLLMYFNEFITAKLSESPIHQIQIQIHAN